MWDAPPYGVVNVATMFTADASRDRTGCALLHILHRHIQTCRHAAVGQGIERCRVSCAPLGARTLGADRSRERAVSCLPSIHPSIQDNQRIPDDGHDLFEKSGVRHETRQAPAPLLVADGSLHPSSPWLTAAHPVSICRSRFTRQ
jgi:hypothetical protein